MVRAIDPIAVRPVFSGAKRLGVALMQEKMPLGHLSGTARSPVHESPARSGDSDWPGSSCVCSHLHVQSVLLSGFSHDMNNGTYILSSTSCRWPSFKNAVGMCLYYQVPSSRWCLNAGLPGSANTMVCSARQVEAAINLPAGKQQWIEACRTEVGTEWRERQVTATVSPTGSASGNPCHGRNIHEQVAAVVSTIAEHLEVQRSQMIVAAETGARSSAIWCDTAARHGDREDLEHMLDAIVGALARLHRTENETPSHVLRGNCRPTETVDAVNAQAMRENECKNLKVCTQLEKTLATVTDEQALLNLPVKLLVPFQHRRFLLRELVPPENEWNGSTCVRVFDGRPLAATVARAPRPPTATGGTSSTDYTLTYAEGNTEELQTPDVRAALMLAQVAAVRQAQKAAGYPVGSVLKLHARIQRVEPGETLASIASSASCTTQELLQLNVSRFTHIAGNAFQYKSECSKLCPGTLLLVPCTVSVLCLRVIKFIGWSMLSTLDGECCWPQWLVADVANPQVKLRCCPPARTAAVQHSTVSPSTTVAAQTLVSSTTKRRRWTAEEDAHIQKEVCASGEPLVWSEIAKGLPGRIGKQCRERWFFQLSPTIIRGPWSKEEEQILALHHQKLGNTHCFPHFSNVEALVAENNLI